MNPLLWYHHKYKFVIQVTKIHVRVGSKDRIPTSYEDWLWCALAQCGESLIQL